MGFYVKDSHKLSYKGSLSACPRKSKLKELDVLRGRLMGSQNDFLWQLGCNINHKPCSRKQLEALMQRAEQRCFELLALISSPTHIKPKVLSSHLSSNWTNLNGLHTGSFRFYGVIYEPIRKAIVAKNMA